MRRDIVSEVAKKELRLFLSSPIGYLFLGTFLSITLFLFFWVESFFARNIADVRPIFEWLPILLIFLSAALTMKMWSEERRTGTLEFMATLPISTWEMVIGKFLACFLLLALALLLTVWLPISVSTAGDLDWGPVFAGYLAALLLGGAYLAIGLFVSARTDSQIVSLIVASLIGGIFYLLGSPGITQLFGSSVSDFLSSLGSGSRFESITRGVVDFRDLYFYISISIVFLAANVYSLERERWSAEGDEKSHFNWRLGTGLLVANLLIANFWLSSISFLRVDVTAGNIYSISKATEKYLDRLEEPLLIRGYFSSKTHPLLSPLVPRMKDLLKEYEVAGNGKVRVELVDPVQDPEIENEANTKYGIRAVPFQTADRYQSSLVNSYFDVLIQYGDEYEVLSFRDLLEFKVLGESDIDVQLKNPEFDVTRSIKKVLFGFQGGSSVFTSISEPVKFLGYLSSDDLLPESLIAFRTTLEGVLAEARKDSDGKFDYELVDPNVNGGELASDIAERFGFQPMVTSILDENGFYYHLTLQSEDAVVQISIPENLSEEGLKKELDNGLKRFASGLLKTVVITAPQAPPPYMQQQGMPPTNQYAQLRGLLTNDFDVSTDDLSSGVVPSGTDVLVIVEPSSFSNKQLFAVDQYLMKGGTVVLSTGAYKAQLSQSSLSAMPAESGFGPWLESMGISIDQMLVMDPQNSSFPVPVSRNVGGFTFQDLVMLDYPYFVDVRGDGLSDDLPITSGIPQVTLSWASPIDLSVDENIDVFTLLESSSGSWLSDDTNVMPRLSETGEPAFEPTGELSTHKLGVLLTGVFGSYFSGQDSPLLEEPVTDDPESQDSDQAENKDSVVISSVIEKSSESARLLVISSNDFLSDQSLQMVGSSDGTLYMNSPQMIVNFVDWALEDESLTSIRARGNFNRTLLMSNETSQRIFEYVNYILAILSVLAVAWFYRIRSGRERAIQESWLAGEGETS